MKGNQLAEMEAGEEVAGCEKSRGGESSLESVMTWVRTDNCLNWGGDNVQHIAEYWDNGTEPDRLSLYLHVPYKEDIKLVFTAGVNTKGDTEFYECTKQRF